MAASHVTLSAGEQRLVLDPASGGRAVSWEVQGQELLQAHGSHPMEHGMYVMAPWAGRLRGNRVMTEHGYVGLPITFGTWAIHGTVVDRAARVASVHDDGDRAEALFVLEDHPEWPWPMRVGVHWILEPDHLTTRIEVEALAEPFPVTVGWHPWFRRHLPGAQARVSMDPEGMLVRDSSGLPVDVTNAISEGPYDDAFLVPSGRARIEWPGRLAIDIESDGRWFVLYDECDDAVCLEPQSGPPDGLIEHPWHEVRRARPGHPDTHTVTWWVRDLREARA